LFREAMRIIYSFDAKIHRFIGQAMQAGRNTRIVDACKGGLDVNIEALKLCVCRRAVSGLFYNSSEAKNQKADLCQKAQKFWTSTSLAAPLLKG